MGVHHLTLEQLLTDPCIRMPGQDRIIERGGDALPEVLAARLSKRT